MRKVLSARIRHALRLSIVSIVAVAATSVSAAAADASTIPLALEGSVSCTHHAVVQLWVNSNEGGSEFVSFGHGLTASSANQYHAVFSTKINVTSTPASISLHVGCGGSASDWWSDNWTSTATSVNGSPAFLDATCNEGTTKSTSGTQTNKQGCSFESVGTAIANAAESQVGEPNYCIDGGTITGQSQGGCSRGITGFDCTGLIIYALYQATGINLTSYHNSTQATNALAQTGASEVRSDSLSALKVGDLIYFGSSFGNISHAAIYIGNGKIVDANVNIGDGNGTGVRIRSLSFEAYGLKFVGAVRY